MPKVLVMGDPHFKISNVKETEAMTESFLAIAREKSPTFIVVLGDVLDRHESIHVSPLTRATKFLAQLTEIAPTFVLIGNHDLKNNRQFLSEEHPFSALKYWGERMTIVDTPIARTFDNKLFVFCPYVPPGRFVEALNTLNVNGKEIWKEAAEIFAHQEFKNCKMGPIISDEGDDWDLSYPHVTSGHIHDYQEPQYNILYTGTPMQHAFGDTHDKTVSYLIYENEDRIHERIDLKLEKKKIVRITAADVSSYQPEENVDLKIIISGISSEIKGIMKHPSVALWKSKGYKVTYKELQQNNSVLIKPKKQEGVPQIKNYLNMLHDAVKLNPELNRWYKTIFGEIEKKKIVLNIIN